MPDEFHNATKHHKTVPRVPHLFPWSLAQDLRCNMGPSFSFKQVKCVISFSPQGHLVLWLCYGHPNEATCRPFQNGIKWPFWRSWKSNPWHSSDQLPTNVICFRWKRPSSPCSQGFGDCWVKKHPIVDKIPRELLNFEGCWATSRLPRSD